MEIFKTESEVKQMMRDKMQAFNAPTWTEKVDMGNGIWCYRNIFKPGIPEKLEEILGDGSHQYKWSPAFVGYQERMPDYRDCMDFKFKRTDIVNDPSDPSLKLQEIWQECFDAQVPALQDYCKMHNIYQLRYWEAFNFIKYEPGHHFMEHHDNGYSYNCVVSLVGYLNDDYDGGELYFRLQQLNIKPQAGDLYIFPSNYMYPHQAKKVHSGTKYSLVTMLDYSEKYHTPELYRETGD
jgi:hypothetical protein